MGISYLKETEEVIAIFIRHGKKAVAQKLRDAVDSASTGTELIMDVKFHLESAPSEDIPEILRPKIRNLIVGISDLLK